MNFYKKRKLKDFFRKRWYWFLGTGTFLIIGGTVAIVGFQLSGWSILSWLQSRYAVTTLIFVIAGLFMGGCLLYFWKRYSYFKK